MNVLQEVNNPYCRKHIIESIDLVEEKLIASVIITRPDHGEVGSYTHEVPTDVINEAVEYLSTCQDLIKEYGTFEIIAI